MQPPEYALVRFLPSGPPSFFRSRSLGRSVCVYLCIGISRVVPVFVGWSGTRRLARCVILAKPGSRCRSIQSAIRRKGNRTSHHCIRTSIDSPCNNESSSHEGPHWFGCSDKTSAIELQMKIVVRTKFAGKLLW